MSNIITVRNLSSRVHKNINWELKKNEIHYIIGPSGEGKSTFLRVLLGLEKKIKGEILDANHKSWNIANHNIGVQFQSGGLLNNLTIGENIMLPLLFYKNIPLKYAQYVAMKCMKDMNLEEDVYYKYPSECSGGMQKRVALARAMILNPEILFLDEPTAGLDHVSSSNYYDLLKKLTNITIVMVTHDIAKVKQMAMVTVFINHQLYQDKFENLLQSDNIQLKEFFKNYV